MPTFKEITDTRKSGNLDEAYQMAAAELENQPDNIWMKRAMGWVLYEYMNKNAACSTAEAFVNYLDEFAKLNFGADERIIYSSVAWALRKLMDSYKTCNCSTAPLDQVLKLITAMPFPKEEDAYGAMLQAAIGIDDKWPNFHLFVEWWNLDNLTPNHFLPVHLQNGHDMMSLGERAYITYSKWLQDNGHQEDTKAFIPKLEDIVKNYHNLTYPPYYLGKLLLKVGENQRAIEVLKPFAKSKARDFWVWQMLGDAHTDANARLTFYCKALDCGGREEMLVALHEDAASVFADTGNTAAAKWEVDKALNIRNSKGWRIPENLMAMTQTDWYKNSQANRSNAAFYDEHKADAEDFLFGVKKQLTVLVTNYNREKHFASFVTEDKHSGFFKWPKDTRQPIENSLYTIKVTELAEKGPTRVFGLDYCQKQENANLLKSFEGPLKKNEKGFGFVSDTFIEAKLIAGKNSGDNVRGKATAAFNKKKNTWGWRAVKTD